MLRRLVISVFAVLFVLGCDDSSGPARNDITGSWSGTGVVAGQTFTLTLLLSENNNVVSGNGSLSLPGAGGFALAAAGTYVDPDFTITLSSQGFQDIAFSGEVNGDDIAGTFTGSGFLGEEVNLTRQ
jgi:hypothetical protein